MIDYDYNNKRMSIIKLLIPSIVMLFVGAVLVGNNKAYAVNVPYSIIYDDNVTSNMPTDVDTTSMSEQVTMANNTPTRPGFRYLGWCNVIPTSSGGTDLCTGGTTYQPSATLTLDQTGTNNFHLYAMWKEDNSMQSFTATKCNAMSTGDTITLTDSRDDQAYTIGKLADGNCWLLDNLALDLTNDTILNGLTADNTNIDITNDPGALAALKGTTLGTTSDKYATAKVANWTSSYSYSAPLVNLTNKDVIPTDATSTAGGYKVGGYYNYCAASAGSYCYGNGTSEGTSSGNATSSICPKGWRMPTGDTSGEYQALYNNSNYNTYANYRAALRLPLPGSFNNGSAYDQGSFGFFWSSTRYNNSYMYGLFLRTSNVYPSDYDSRNYGNSIRCLLSS